MPFQFTPLREGRRIVMDKDAQLSFISIHAPAGGATACQIDLQNQEYISIHAPAGGATQAHLSQSTGMIFKFTPLREGRRHAAVVVECAGVISIHAPAGGATCTPRSGSPPSYFNSRPCGRGDPSPSTDFFKHQKFQFTPLREGRPARSINHVSESNFNSRPCGRGDG